MRPQTVVVLLLLTATAWGWNWWHQARNAPVNARIEAGIEYSAQGQGMAAEREWKEAVALDPRNVTAWELLGDYYLAAGNPQAARDAFNHVLKLHPQTQEIHYRLATCNAQLKDMDEAERHAHEELKRNPNHVDTLDLLTTVLADLNKAKDRLKYLRQLVELQPQNDRYIAQLANLLLVEKQYAQARPWVEKLLKLKPESGVAYAMRAASVFHTNPTTQELRHAVTDLEKSLAENPNDAVARFYMGKIYLRLKEPKQAIFHFEKLDRLADAQVSYLLELAKAYQMAGSTDKARALRERYGAIEKRREQVDRLKIKLDDNPRDFDATLGVGLLLLDSEKPVNAEKYIVAAARLRPTDPRAREALKKLETRYVHHLRAALEALNQRDFDQVGRRLSKAMMLRPYDARTAKALQQFQAAAVDKAPPGSTGASKPDKSTTQANQPQIP